MARGRISYREQIERAAALEAKRKALADLDAASYQKAAKNLEYFFRKAWRVLEPSTPLMTNWHQGCIAEYLTAARRRQIKRLIINIPPRYTKSNLVSVAFNAWCWIEEPHLRFLNASYSGALATKHSMDRRTLMESRWYQAGYGDSFKFQHGDNLKTRFSNDHRGHMIATSMSGGGTGMGGDFVTMDDPHDTTRAGSDVKREKDNLEFDRKFSNRLDDKENGVIIIVMQRLHEADLTGHVIEKGGLSEEGGIWTQLKLPVTAPERTVVVMPITGTEIVREEGDILHEERQDAAALDQEKINMGSYTYSGQYDQEPSPREGGILKKSYWRYYDPMTIGKFEELIMSVDCTFTNTDTADHVAIGIWGRIGPNRYLVDTVVRRMGFWDTIKAIILMRAKHPRARKYIIEKKANGDAIIQTFQSKITGIIPALPVGSKVERAYACEPELESHCVYLPGPEERPPVWVTSFVDECAKFPKSKRDDQVDQFTQAMIYWGSKKTDTLRKLLKF